MKSTIESSEGLKRTLNIEIGPEAVTEAFEKQFKKIQKDAEAPGFRKGKVPMDQVKAKYRTVVVNDVVESLVNSGYIQALQEHKLHPINMPQIDLNEITEDKGFSFKATLEVRPEIELKKYKDFKLEKESGKVDEEKIEGIIKQILESKADKTPVFEDRPSKDGDFVDINFEGFMENGEPLPNGAANNFILELGSKSFIPGFEDGLVGAKAGSEKTLDLSFPEDYQAAEIAGKNVKFKVKVNKIMKKDLPELTDALVESLGDSKVKTVDELKSNIESDLKRSEEEKSLRSLQESVLKSLIDNNEVTLPDSLVEQQKAGLIENSNQTLKSQGMSEEEITDYNKKWDDDYTKNAKDIIHVSLLMDAIADKEKLRPDAKEIDSKIDEIASQAGPNAAKVREYYSDANRKDSLYYKLMEDKVVSFVIENSNITEK